ncbi:peptidase inhibitor family I36 protein [Streptomyces sp. BI20]|uniref:peptidase inhibitor family I36 protein n=1 Tax=Streptomyces sp. BI20 TaxID=3403460 RepID=UPI003C72FD0E
MRRILGRLAAVAFALALTGGATGAAQAQPDAGQAAPTAVAAGAPQAKDALVGPFDMSKGESAALGWDNCLHGQACLFQNANGGGWMWVVPACNVNYNLNDYGINNKTSSVWNRAGSTLYAYDGNGTGLLATYAKFGPTINVPSAHNDKISSVWAPCGG